MIIREATPDDIADIAKLYIANWKKTYRGLFPNEFLDGLSLSAIIRKFTDFLKTPNQKIFIACEKNHFYGFSSCKKDDILDKCFYLSSLHVSELARKKGIGTKLIHTVGNYALEKGYPQLSICVVQGNHNAKKLYEKLGAIHLEYFTEDFDGATSSSEKLIWNDTQRFA